MNDSRQEDLRSLVSGIYDIQKLRIATGNRIAATFASTMIGEEEEKEKKEKKKKSVIKSMSSEYKTIARTMDETGDSLKKSIMKSDDIVKFIKTDYDFKLFSTYVRLCDAEDESVKLLAKRVANEPIYQLFLKDTKGCGTLMSGVILAYVNIHECRHASCMWKYAGLDVVTVVHDDGSVTYEGKSRKHLVEQEYTDRNGEVKTKMGLGYNPFLKSKLIGVLGPGFLKCRGSHYDTVYRNYRHRIDNEPRFDGYSDGHKHNMAIRYAVKIFLRDLWVAWRRLEGYDVGLSYEEAFLGRKPHGYNQALADMQAFG